MFSGADENGVIAEKVEMYVDRRGWRSVNSATRLIEWYPRMHLLPNGDTFQSGPEQISGSN